MTTGFQVLPRASAIDGELVRRGLAVPVSTISDSMHRLSASTAALRPIHDGTRLSGTAFTVRTRPGDNLMVHLALDLAEPGDVIVVDAGGDLTNAILGELMVIHATARGLGGFVVHGAIRDSDEIARQSFPVYAAGITHRGPYKDGPGEINVPVSLGGMTVQPGDLVVGDGDGVLAIPAAEADAILAAAERKDASEQRSAADFRAGTSDRTAIRARAIALGAEFVG